MNFVLPADDEIAEACRLGGCDIFNYQDARRFLLTDEPGKNLVNRFISYLICLKIIPPSRQKWIAGINKALQLYYDHAGKYFDKSNDDPLSILPVKYEEVMRTDFPRTNHWFEGFAKDMKLDLTKFNDVVLRVSRIFAVMGRELKDRHYTQGYDRFAFAFLGLGAVFCNQNNLSYDVAEALAYHLTNNVLSLLPMATLLDKQDELQKHFEKLDKVLMNYNTSQYMKIKNGGGSLILFGVRWELTLFADEHIIDDTFRIWDQIFGRLESYSLMIMAFTIAHVSQVVIPTPCMNVLECVIHFDKWNTTELVQVANEILNHHRTLVQNCCEYFCPKLPSLHGYEISEMTF